MLKKTDGFKNNSENLSTAKIGKQIQSGFSRSAISSFKSTENKDDVYRGKDCIKSFCESFKEHATNIKWLD